MRIRSVLGVSATIGGLLAVGLAPNAGAAEAAVSSAANQPAAAANAPTVSPSAPYEYSETEAEVYCGTGNFCVSTWDKTKKKYKTFKLRKCATYSLSYFEGKGVYHNHQTGNRATASFYDQKGKTIKTVPTNKGDYYNFTPVWKIRNCY